MPLTLDHILALPRGSLEIHAQAAVHYSPLSQNLGGGLEALVFFGASADNPLGQQRQPLSHRNRHSRPSDGDGKGHETTKKVCCHCYVPGGSKKKAMMSFQFLGCAYSEG